MAVKALEQIKEAEASAEKIRGRAAEQANGIRADAHARGRALLEGCNTALREERKQSQIAAEESTAKILADAKASAEDEAQSLTDRASGNLKAASALIMERIRMLWQ